MEEIEIQVSVDTAVAIENMRDFTRALDDAREATIGLDRSLSPVAATLTATGDAAGGAATNIDSMATKLGLAAEGLQAVGDKGPAAKDAVKDIAKSSDNAGKGLTKAAKGAHLFTLAFVGIEAVAKTLEQIDKIQQRIVENSQKLGMFKLNMDQQLQPLAAALRTGQDPSGESHLRDLSMSFRSATGATIDQTKQILAAAYAAGKDVRTPTSAGFGEAEEVGKFASRMGLSDDVAGELMKFTSNSSSVTDAASARKMLAKLEGTFSQVNINDPSSFYGAMIKSTTARMEAGVPYDQAIGQLAAVAQGNPDPAAMATEVNRFSEITGGASRFAGSRRRLATIAAKRGLISEPAISAQEQRDGGPDPDQVEELDRMRREVADLQNGQIPHDNKLTMDAEFALRSAKNSSSTNRRKLIFDAQANMDAVPQKIAAYAARITDHQARIKKLSDQMASKSRGAALDELYEALPRGTQEQLVYDVTEGMSQGQLQAWLANIAPGRESQSIALQLGPQGRAARARAMGPASRGDLRDYARAERKFRTGDIAQAQQAAVQQDIDKLKGTPAGQTYADQVSAESDADVTTLETQGKADIGWWFGFKGADDVMAHPEQRYMATSEESFKGEVEAYRARLNFVRFVRSMTPAQRKRFAGEISRVGAFIDQKVTTAHHYATNWAGAGHAQASAQQAAQEVGKFRETVQGSAIQMGEHLPQGDEPQRSFPVEQQQHGDKGIVGDAGTAGPSGHPVADGGHSDASVHHHYGAPIINQHVGILMTHDDEVEDLPGRGEGWF